MLNIFLFIRKHAVFIFFLVLQVFCLYLISHYNQYQHAVVSGAMNEVTGKINSRFNQVEDYLYLKKANEDLSQENARLRNQLKQNFENPDTSHKTITDSIAYDTLGHKRKWEYFPAKVISNSVGAQNNYIGLGRGSLQNLHKDMGVVDPTNAVVGIITDVTDNYAVVMSLLHKDSKISGKLKKGGDVGQVVWDGKDPNILSLTDIRQSAKETKGDTVLTSGFTPTFPAGLMIGTVLEAIPDKSTNGYLIKLKSSANFYNLQYIDAIDNQQASEIEKMIEKAKKKEN